MKYKVILEKGKYALIVRKNNLDEYAVVSGLDKETGIWDFTCDYWNFSRFGLEQSEALSEAIDCFRAKTEPNYIPRCRLEELATQFKDELIEDDRESVMEFFDEVCEMETYEKEFFGIEGVEED